MEMNYDFMFKIVLMGDSGVGKTQILEQFCGVDPNLPAPHPLPDMNSKIVQVQGSRIKLQIWDTAGQERFKSILSAYCRQAEGIVLVYNVAQALTLANLSQWIYDIRQHGEDPEMIVLGYQQRMDSIRVLSREDGEAFAAEYGFRYIEASADDNINIETAFMDLTQAILNRPV